MKKLINGIVDFRKNVLPSYRETFSRLALGQSPDSLFFACSDSRIAVNLFASTDPGDLFVVRNVGNLVPPCGECGISTAGESEGAAIEFALTNLKVSDIIVCGHSECGAMQALIQGRENISSPNLKAWLRHGEASLSRLGGFHAPGLSEHNELSQANVLQQIEHLKSYPAVREGIVARSLKIHGWWFELSRAEVYAFEEEEGRFVLIDEDEAARILRRLEE